MLYVLMSMFGRWAILLNKSLNLKSLNLKSLNLKSLNLKYLNLKYLNLNLKHCMHYMFLDIHKIDV